MTLPFRKKKYVRPSGALTAIEWEGTQLRLVQGEARGDGCRLTRVEEGALQLLAEENNDPAVIGKAIAKSIEHLKVKISGPVVMGIPRGQVVLRTLTLPDIKDVSALAAMVHFQMAKDLPFRSDEAVIDFKVRGKVPGGDPENPKQEVLAAAVKRDIVDFYKAVAEGANLPLSSLGLLSYANARCLEACHVTDPEQTIALVSVRKQEIGVDLIGKETLLFSRNALVKLYGEDEEPPHEPLVPPEDGSAPAAEPSNGKATTFEEVATIEVVRTLHGYGSSEDAAPTRVVVTGVTGLEEKIAELVGERLPIACSVLDIGAALDLPGEARSRAAGAIGPIGLVIGAFDGAGSPFNFLSPKQPAQPRNLKKIRRLAAAAAAVLALAAIFSVRAQLIKKKMAQQKDLQEQLAGMEKQLPLFKKMINQAKVIDGWSRGGRDWLAHYAYLSEILPPSEEVYITSLTVGGNGTVRLGVQARNGEILAKMEKQLRAARYDVKPIAITPATDRYGYDFRSTFELVVSDKLKLDLNKVKAPARPADDASLDPAPLKKGSKG